MYARIEREFDFQAAIHFEGNFIINSYSILLSMNVLSEDLHEQNIAFERIKYFIEYCLENSIFVDIKEKSPIDLYLKAGLKVCVLPDEPFDQIIAAVLLSKLNAITEKKLFVTELKILSKISDGVSFYINHDEAENFANTENVWYTENNANITDINRRHNRKDKIVELKKESTDWNVIGLGWKSLDIDTNGNKIIFTSHDK